MSDKLSPSIENAKGAATLGAKGLIIYRSLISFLGSVTSILGFVLPASNDAFFSGTFVIGFLLLFSVIFLIPAFSSSAFAPLLSVGTIVLSLVFVVSVLQEGDGYDKSSPVSEAVSLTRGKDPRLVEDIFKNSTLYQEINSGECLLHEVFRYGDGADDSLLEMVINRSSYGTLNAETEDGETPLGVAITSRNLRAVKYLLLKRGKGYVDLQKESAIGRASITGLSGEERYSPIKLAEIVGDQDIIRTIKKAAREQGIDLKADTYRSSIMNSARSWFNWATAIF